MKLCKGALSVALLLGMSSIALAIPVHTEITIFDGNSGAGAWYDGPAFPGDPAEDDETEPGTIRNQAWDLESMFLYDGSLLGMIGGYNFFFPTVETDPGLADYRPGDIFIDINGSALPGSAPTYGYEYVLDVDWSALTYDVYLLSVTSVLSPTSFIPSSNPWRYVSGGTLLASGLTFTSETGLSNATVGKLGGSTTGYSNLNGLDKHNAAYGFDLGFLPVGTVFTAHFTTSCGNDNLMGSGTVVPVPAAVWLLGSALGLLGVVRRRARS